MNFYVSSDPISSYHTATLTQDPGDTTLSNVKEAYSDLVDTMRALGNILIPATAAQYDAPPGGPSGRDAAATVRNPTLEIVLDPRRDALSDAVTAASSALRQARALLHPHVPALQHAVARWEGQEGPDL